MSAEGGWNDPEAIEQERHDADVEQSHLEAEGRYHARRSRRSAALRAAGRLAEAADACPHGGGYPLSSLAATNANDPRAGQVGVRCSDCGSVLSAWPYDDGIVVHPCEELTPCTQPTGPASGHGSAPPAKPGART